MNDIKLNSISFNNTRLSDIRLSEQTIEGSSIKVIYARPANSKTIPVWVRNFKPIEKINNCEIEPTNLLIIFDESGSVFSYSDPILYRHELTLMVAKAFQKACTCKRCTIGITTFNTETSFQPSQLSNVNIKDLEYFLTKLPYTNSQLSDSLKWAKDQAGLLKGKTVLAVFSDFELFDPIEDNVFENLANFDGTSLAVVLKVEPNQELIDKSIDYIRIDTNSRNTYIGDLLIKKINSLRTNPVEIKPIFSVKRKNRSKKKRKSLIHSN